VQALDPQVMVSVTGRPELKAVAGEATLRLQAALAAWPNSAGERRRRRRRWFGWPVITMTGLVLGQQLPAPSEPALYCGQSSASRGSLPSPSGEGSG
jgi:hypothetical protein